MDIRREGVARKRRLRWTAFVILGGAAVAAAGWRVAHLEPALPSVERGTVITDTVRRGEILVEVRGLGTLVPEDIVWIPAAFESQVNKILVKSGQSVVPSTVLMVLSNPNMELEATNLEWQVKQAEANLTNLKVTLESQRLNQEAAVATVRSDLDQARLAKDRDEALLKFQLKSELEVKLTVARWEQFVTKYDIEKQRLEIMKESTAAQLDAQRVQIESQRAAWQLKRRQVDELTVRAGTSGVIQEVSLQPGQRVQPGAVLAKVAQPRKLKAELKIAETQAKDIALGQKASIDTRNGIVAGRVIRIDPNVVNGTRTIDCSLEGPLPPGAVPDLSVDGTVEIERMKEVVYIGRPTFGQPNSSVTLFRLDPQSNTATRVPVKLGRSSVSVIQVLEGLNVGDQVILSDMPGQDQSNRIRLE